MNFKTISFIILLSVFSACSHVNYVGRTYEQTKNVDVYFSESDTDTDYEVIGHAISAGQIFVSVEELKEKLVEEAKLNGADAIIITGIDRDVEPEGHGFDAEKQLKATFIKYKL